MVFVEDALVVAVGLDVGLVVVVEIVVTFASFPMSNSRKTPVRKHSHCT